MKKQTGYNQKEYTELWTLAEAAQHCGVSPRTVQRWIAQGELPAVQFGKRAVRVSSEAVRVFIAQKTRVHAVPMVIPRNEPCAAQRLADLIRFPLNPRIR